MYAFFVALRSTPKAYKNINYLFSKKTYTLLLTKPKMTFDEVYEEWSKEKFPTVSESNIKGYKASYKTCGILYNRVFKDLKLADLQQVIDTCGKNYPTLKKIKILFNQLYEFALKNDICNKDYSTFVEITQYKDLNPNKHTRTKFTKEEVAKVWTMKEDNTIRLSSCCSIMAHVSLNFLI
ncbi:hypothetical protein [Ruminococcus intestinalis]|uniref:hypothetical protein n=1 Tax=Ruminococcus intestinalis TaxID=2763066 RepID=UPI003F7F651E